MFKAECRRCSGVVAIGKRFDERHLDAMRTHMHDAHGYPCTPGERYELPQAGDVLVFYTVSDAPPCLCGLPYGMCEPGTCSAVGS